MGDILTLFLGGLSAKWEVERCLMEKQRTFHLQDSCLLPLH